MLDDPAFQSAFLAVRHLLGASKSTLPGVPSAHAVELATALAAPDRAVRAGALARELERIARGLEERRVA